MPDWDEDVAAVVNAAWPDGAPDQEWAVLASMPRDRLYLTVRRLSAVVAAERGERLGDLAAGLGMDRVAFFRLRQRWSSARTVRSLAPFAGRELRQVGVSYGFDLVPTVMELMRSGLDFLPDGALANQVVKRLPGVTRQTAIRAVRRARTERLLETDRLAATIGRHVLLDLSGTSLTVAEAGPRRHRAVALMVDVASGLIIGHAAGDLSEGLPMQARACEAACRSWPREFAAGSAPAVAEVTAGPGPESSLQAMLRVGQELGVSVSVAGDRRFGQRLVEVLGHRLGRVRLHPRLVSSRVANRERIIAGAAPPLDATHADALIAEGIRDHNLGRLRRIFDDPLGPHSASPTQAVADDAGGLLSMIEAFGLDRTVRGGVGLALSSLASVCAAGVPSR